MPKNKYIEHFSKTSSDAGMAVPRLHKIGVGIAVCRQDMLHIPTHFFAPDITYAMRLLGRAV